MAGLSTPCSRRDRPLDQEQLSEGLRLLGVKDAERLRRRWVSYSRLGSLGSVTVSPWGSNASAIWVASLTKSRTKVPSLSGWVRFSRDRNLHGSEAGERLVDVHRIQLGLVEPGLELLSHDQEPVGVGVEAGSRLGVGEPVELSLGHLVAVVADGPGDATSTPRS